MIPIAPPGVVAIAAMVVLNNILFPKFYFMGVKPHFID
jgi:hypothetical protein